LLETDSAGSLPLRGTTFTTGFVFGNTFVTITTSPRGSLSGTVSEVLPWAIVAGGLLLTFLAALLAGRLVRGRDDAERLSREVRELYLEQRSVAETLQHALLPSRLPAIPGMVIEARYRPSVTGVDIGGDVAAHTVRLANAGHLPLVVSSEGQSAVVPVKPGPPIGIPDGFSYEESVVTVPPRGVLIAYTDGLVERRGEMVDAGIKRLQRQPATTAVPWGSCLTASSRS
jgi:hypothetical protein